MVPFTSTAKEVSFERSHHRISATDSKVRTTLYASIINYGNERNKGTCEQVLGRGEVSSASEASQERSSSTSSPAMPPGVFLKCLVGCVAHILRPMKIRNKVFVRCFNSQILWQPSV